MKSLQDKVWQPNSLPSIFNSIKRGKRFKKGDHTQGSVPYVSSTESNNGVDAFIEAKEGTRSFKNCISLANSGSVGAAFYEPFEFVASDHATSLERESATVNEYLFLATTIIKQRKNFDFNREINESRVNKMQAMLPVDENGEPDYDFMERYVSEKTNTLFTRYKTFLKSQLADLEHVDIPALSEKEWKGFVIRDLFKTVKRGAKTYMPTGALVSQNQLSKGNMPRIRVTSMNNGVGEFTADNSISNFRTFSNFVSVSFLGSAFYQKHESSLDMKVHCLQLKEREMNQYIGHFIAVMMKNNVKGVTYGNQLSSEDLVSKRILLPTTNEGEPDWDYMEQYAKNLMLKKYQQYLEFLGGQGL